jgi:hypothetical protein
MSELTQCNWHSLQAYYRRYGKGNVRLRPGTGELGGLDVFVREGPDQPWSEEPAGWFWVLTDHCVC